MCLRAPSCSGVTVMTMTKRAWNNSHFTLVRFLPLRFLYLSHDSGKGVGASFQRNPASCLTRSGSEKRISESWSVHGNGRSTGSPNSANMVSVSTHNENVARDDVSQYAAVSPAVNARPVCNVSYVSRVTVYSREREKISRKYSVGTRGLLAQLFPFSADFHPPHPRRSAALLSAQHQTFAALPWQREAKVPERLRSVSGDLSGTETR